MSHLFRDKKTKTLLWVLAGVFVIFLGVLLYSYANGSLKGSASTTGPTFSDVPTDFWAYKEIDTDAQFGLIAGYSDGTFRPRATVTRDQGAVFLARLVAGNDTFVPDGPATAHCTDVPTSNWSYKYVEYLISQGIIGTDCKITTSDIAKYYKPTKNLSRADLSVLTARVISGEDGVLPGTDQPTFSDVPTTNVAYNYIEYLASQGVINGYDDGTFRPTGTVSRDQMAVFMYRAYDLGTALDYINGGGGTAAAGGLAVSRALAIDTKPDFSGGTANGTLYGKVTDAKTNKPIAGATVTIKCNNPIEFLGQTVKEGTNTTATTDGSGNYSVEIETRFVGKVGAGGFSWKPYKKVWDYKITATASGYEDSKPAMRSFPNQKDGSKLEPPQNFALQPKGTTPGTTTANFVAYLKHLKPTSSNPNATESICMQVLPVKPVPAPGTVGCTVTINLEPVGSHPDPWMNVGRHPGGETIPVVGVGQKLAAGTYKVTGGSIDVISGPYEGTTFSLYKVGGNSLPYTFTIRGADLGLNFIFK